MEHKIMDGIGARQAGYDDALYDGIDTFGEFGCNCEKCRAEYEAGWNEGMEELEASLIQHAKNFVPATPPPNIACSGQAATPAENEQVERNTPPATNASRWSA